MTEFKKTFQQFAKENNFSPDPIQDKAVDALDQVYQNLIIPAKKGFFSRRSNKVKGIYIWGGVGRGKTMVMDLFFVSLPSTKKRRVHFNIFMLDVHNSIKLLREDGKGADPLLHIADDIAKNCHVLCFDEFQVYDIADAMVLSGLFGYLFDKGVVIIATSNVAPDDLYKNGLQRARFLPFIPLVKQHMNVIHLDNNIDYRQQALRDDGVYFIQSESKMNTLFKKLTSPINAQSSEINVSGRTLPITRMVNEMAWLDFSELCEKPRAAADYQALTQSFDTIFLNKVPRMGYDRRNEAKRFILLIDTLYDAGIRLILNAEDVPEKLYQGKDHAFEFERTISRLLEMQGEEYLSKTNAHKIDKI